VAVIGGEGDGVGKIHGRANTGRDLRIPLDPVWHADSVFDSLDAAVESAVARYVDRHPISARLAARAAAVLPGGNTRSVLHVDPFAFRVAGASGAWLRDVDGHTYLDLLGDYSAGLLGRNPRVAEVVRDVLERGWSYGAMSDAETVFAEAVVARFPSVEQVRFTNSGSEANVLALMTARHVTGRPRVVVFDGAYHGGPLYFGPGGEALRVPFEYAVLPYNDVDALAAELTAHGERVAAVLVEPMLGAGGCLPGRREFLTAARTLSAQCGALLVFDEVMTSRLAPGGAQELLAITPDLTTLGKYLAGGFSFGAFGGRRDVMAAFDPAAGGGLTHGGTFNNNAFTMAVGGAVAGFVDGAALAAVNGRGERLRQQLNDRFDRCEVAFTATGWGSLLSIHPVRGPVERPADLADADPRWRLLLFHELLERGYYIAPRGYLALTMDVSDGDLDGFLDAIDEVIVTR
jgi:glutamate-1-semialdehyde 2,1-aminomutase